MAKGFRKTKQPTKSQVQKENQDLQQVIDGKLQSLQSVLFQGVQQQQQHIVHLKNQVGRLADVLRCVESDQPAEWGDQVMVDFIGYLKTENGIASEPFQGSFAMGNLVRLDSESGFLPDFLKQLEGISALENKEITIRFPDNYPSEELKGNEAIFKIFCLKVFKEVGESLPEKEYLDFMEKKAEEEKKAKEAEEARKEKTLAETEAVVKEQAEESSETSEEEQGE